MKSTLITLLGSASTALAAVRGFNYAAQGQSEAQFEASFKTAAGLEGADDYTGARLYTMIQEGTTNDPIDAIKAAIATKTTLLLGLWASSPQSQFDNEIAALKSAISQYGSEFSDLVTGISVGSEDLYRISETGLENDPIGVGQTPDTLVDYIKQTRDAIEGTALSSAPVGHVDTWNAFINGSNNEVIAACDFLGLDEYPYFQTTDPNSIENGANLFFEAYDKVSAVAGGKQIWITEAGWPVSGPVSGDAIASVENAATFWHEVACELEKREINFWWYILDEGSASPSFSVSQNGVPLYDLSCNATSGYKPSNSSSTGSNSTVSSATLTSDGSTSSAVATGGAGAGGHTAGEPGQGTPTAGGADTAGDAEATGGAAATGGSATAGGSAPESSTYEGAAEKIAASFTALFLASAFAVCML